MASTHTTARAWLVGCRREIGLNVLIEVKKKKQHTWSHFLRSRLDFVELARDHEGECARPEEARAN